MGHRLFIFEAEFNEKEMTLKSLGLVRDNVIININAHSSCTAIADICIDFSGHFIGGYFALLTS